MRRATRSMSSATPSFPAYSSTRAATSGGSGTRSIAPSNISCTMRVRNDRFAEAHRFAELVGGDR